MILYEIEISNKGTSIVSDQNFLGFSKCSPLITSIKNCKANNNNSLKFFSIDFRPEFYKEIITDYKNLPNNSIYKTSSRDLDQHHIENIISQIEIHVEKGHIIIFDFTWENANYKFAEYFLGCLNEKYQSSYKFIFITSNSRTYTECIDFYCDNFFEVYSQEKFINSDYPVHDISKKDKKFVSLNRKPRSLRLKFIEKLYKNDLEKFIHLSHPHFQKYKEKKLDSDLNYFDKSILTKASVENYTEIVNQSLLKEDFFNTINIDLFEKSFWNLVTESCIEYQEKVIFITEKTFKCFYGKMPFIIYGPPGILAELKKLNYKTFDEYIDESYDQELDDQKRLDKVIDQIKKLSTLSNDDFNHMYSDIQKILEWNFNNFHQRYENQEIGKKLVDFLENSKYN